MEKTYLAPQQINPSILTSMITSDRNYDMILLVSQVHKKINTMITTGEFPEDLESVNEHFDTVKIWSDNHQTPVYLGEFGADNQDGYSYGTGTLRKINSNLSGYADGGPDSQSRIAYHRYIAQEAINRGFSFSAWDSGPTSNKTIHKRNDSNLTIIYDISSFTVDSYDEISVTASDEPDLTTWVTEIKDAVINNGFGQHAMVQLVWLRILILNAIHMKMVGI